MVRKKSDASKRASVFAPPGKVMLIQRNKGSLSPVKTPRHPSSLLQTSQKSLNKSAHQTTLSKSQTEPKKRKFSQALKAIREIKKYQSTVRLLIPRASFSRVVREIAGYISGHSDIRFTALSLMALQEAAEMAMINLLEVANLCSHHAKRVTLTPADIRLTRRAFGIGNALNG